VTTIAIARRLKSPGLRCFFALPWTAIAPLLLRGSSGLAGLGCENLHDPNGTVLCFGGGQTILNEAGW
jgi:hypothetical protein